MIILLLCIIVGILILPYIPALLYGIYIALCGLILGISQTWPWIVGGLALILVWAFLITTIIKKHD